MRRSILIVSWLASSAVAASQQPLPVTHPIPAGHGVIAGHVLDAVTRKPIANAEVSLRPTGEFGSWSPGLSADPTRRASTDSGGAFSFAELGPIEFELIASRRGYGEGGPGRSRPRGTIAPIQLAQDERLSGIDILMWPPARLTGRVVDERGRRLADVQVHASGERFTYDEQRFEEYSAGATTDENGEYEISLFDAGRFILCVSADYRTYPIPPLTALQLRNADPAAIASRDPWYSSSLLVSPDGRSLLAAPQVPLPLTTSDGHTSAYVSTCAPGATTVASAAVIDAVPGARRQVPDLTLQSQRGLRVSGTLVGPNGPIADAWLRLLRPDRERTLGDAVSSVLTARDGSFTFMIAPPGAYRIAINVMNPPPKVTPSAAGFPSLDTPDSGMGDPNGYWTDMPVIVRDVDLDGVVIRAQLGVTVSGSTTIDDPLVGQTPEVGVHLSLGAELWTVDRSSRPGPPGPFVIEGVQPGRYGVSISALGSRSVLSMTSHGQDVIDAPLDVGAAGISDLTIVLTSHPAGISGIVRDTAGNIVRDATVAIFPVDRAQWHAFTEEPIRLRLERASRGHYTISELPPNDYFIAAIGDELTPKWPSESVLTLLAATAERVSIVNGEQRKMDLTVRKRR